MSDRRPADARGGSIVIPAHDEAAVIARCLDALFVAGALESVEVVVACNGCTDDTAERARATGHPVTVLETEVPSKPVALRMADEATEGFPRIYLDADVVLDGHAADAVLERLRRGPELAARPPIAYDTSRASWPVAAYYRARTRAPAVMNSLWGAGVYGLSAGGRDRFGEFPDVVAEDLFIDGLFGPDEVAIVTAPAVTVMVPRRVRPLLNILRRTYRGNAEQRDTAGPAVHPQNSSGSVARQIIRSARDPRSAFDAIMYLGLALVARGLVAVGPAPRWERDDSSRED